MRAVVQRVTEASVTVGDAVTGRIAKGFAVLLGVECGDTDADLRYIADKVENLRVFEDAQGKMNLALADVGGAILLVSQFTLLGDARGGRRPSFTQAARPPEAVPLYEHAAQLWRERGLDVQTGVFGADMQLSLVNDGPVTILLDSKKTF